MHWFLKMKRTKNLLLPTTPFAKLAHKLVNKQSQF